MEGLPQRKADYARLFSEKYTKRDAQGQVIPELSFGIQESYLRRELTIVNTGSSYDFKFLQGDQTAGPNEQYLNKNDVFEITSIGFYLINQTDASPGAETLATYPNIQTFPDVSGFVSRQLMVFYNGKLTYTVGTTQFVQAIDTKRFLYVPQTQRSSATNFDMLSLDIDGRVFLDPALSLNGANDNTWTLSIPSFTGMTIASVTSGTTYKIGLDLRGFLIKGAAQAYTKG